MIEFNYQPFTTSSGQEGIKEKSQERSYPLMPNKYLGLRPRNSYYPAPIYYNYNQQDETPINQTYHLESNQKSYWWLWFLPILGVIILAYWYWKDDIDAFIKKSINLMDLSRKDDKSPKILED